MVLLGLIIFTFVLAVNASLSANYPVNAQLPPVARVSKPFKFVFSQGTFGESDGETKYSLSDAPSWLHVDSKSRTLSGTPQSDDVGDQKFKLNAKGPSGSASMDVTLAVSEDDGPKPGKPLLPQLAKFGASSPPSNFFIRPGDSFSMAFDSDTFVNTGNSTVYYGTSPENSPLPSWMNFQTDTLQFSGTAPKGGSQSFTFNLVASDVPGFSAVTTTFNIDVRPHIFSFNDTVQTVSLTRGEEFSSPPFHEFLMLDGETPDKSDLTDITVESPDWLTVDNETISLSGTPPKDAVNENVTISVTDTHEDVAKMILSMEYSQLFVKDATGCDATIGEDFSFVFGESILTDKSADLDVDLGDKLASWLSYDADKKTLSGHIPKDISPQKFTVDLTATKGPVKDTRTFDIDVAEAGHHDHSSTDKTVESDSANDGASSGGGMKKSGIIAVAVIIPCAFVISIAFLICCWRRKRRGAAPQEEKGDFPTEKPPPSEPDTQQKPPQCEPFEDPIAGSMPEPSRSPSPSAEAPKLELKPFFNADTFEKADAFVTTTEPNGDEAADKENAHPQSTVEGGLVEEPERESGDALTQKKRFSFQTSASIQPQATNQSPKREPLKPIQARRSLKRNSAASSRSKRNSKRSSGISTVAAGLPVRFSGAGHGAGGFGPSGPPGPPGHGLVRTSWQNTQASMQSDESGLGNLAPLFPRPPPRARESVEYPRRMSMRALGRENSTISESDSLEQFVHTRAKSRNSSNPMFSGQGNRRTSAGQRALDRKRSTASRADTVSSANYTIYAQDDNRQSLQERPFSTARSASIYTDDNRQSYIRPMSHMSYAYAQPAQASLPQGTSQLSLGQNYRDVIAPLPRFGTEASIGGGGAGNGGSGGGARRLEDVDEYGDMAFSDSQYGYLGRENSQLKRRSSSCYDWRHMSSFGMGDEASSSGGPLRKSPSLPMENMTRRMSSLRSTAEKGSWRTMSAEDSQEFPRDQSSYRAFI